MRTQQDDDLVLDKQSHRIFTTDKLKEECENVDNDIINMLKDKTKMVVNMKQLNQRLLTPRR